MNSESGGVGINKGVHCPCVCCCSYSLLLPLFFVCFLSLPASDIFLTLVIMKTEISGLCLQKQNRR